MINEFKSYHGSAFADLVDDSSVPIKIFRPDQDNNAFYVLDDNIALYVKHSTKRLTPWRFTFHTDHMNDLIEILNSFELCFIVLICGRDSIAVLDRDEIYKVLPVESASLSWISVQTSHNTSLTIEGSKSKLKRKIKKSKPFWKIHEILSSRRLS